MKLLIRLFVISLALPLMISACQIANISTQPPTQVPENGTILFGKEVLFQPDMWVIEDNQGESGFVKQGIEIKNYGGISFWFKPKLKAPVQIEYTATLLSGNSRYDRTSDLNAFWMAHDPRNPDDLFADKALSDKALSDKTTRTGAFQNYHHFKLYYAGTGVHNNTTTRFRRYDGNIDRPLLAEHDLTGQFLLEANKAYKIKIVSTNTGTQFYRDGKLVFDLKDPQAYTQGWFAFRTFRSHQLITDFKVTQLAN